jgi:hypothetical protein
VNERGALPDEQFACERLCLWGGLGAQSVIDPDVWRETAEEESNRGSTSPWL